ncbi:AMP-binding protein [uncultured Ruegeria sp.]|uniref:AMP-binding protein n=1 Tax=uncultured Ruegeria sp. TaxID=259304 RepID=UPI002620EB5A|nr:AMP-binding protein [uncultured Ruegeria sp.]
MTIYRSRYPDLPDTHETVTQRVFRSLETRLSDTVVTDGTDGRALTAQALMDHIKRLAGGLVERGLSTGTTIAIMAANSPEYCIVFHGVAWAGGTITTLNPTYTASEVKHQITDSGASVLVVFADFLPTAKEAVADLPDVSLYVIGEAVGVAPLSVLYGTALEEQVPVDLNTHNVVVPYSSGTTGLPKGVLLSHRNLVMNIDQTATGALFETGETAAAFLPFFHIYGMNVIMNMHLACGGAFVTMPRFDLELFLRISQDYKARRMWVVPPVALALAKHPMVDEFDLSSIDQVFSGAAPMGAELSDAVSDRLGCAMLQGFGMTELAPVSHATPVSEPRAGSSGLALPNTECRIVNPDTGEDLPAGEAGEMWIRGPQVMQAYLNNPEATKDTLTPDGWLKTGDVASIDADGFMFIVDRLKELIKFKGFQVAPAELEATMVAHSGVQEAAVIGEPDDEAGEVPVAFIVRATPDLTEEDVHAHMRTSLASYKQLHAIRFVDEIPKSPSGKILRRLLRDKT